MKFENKLRIGLPSKGRLRKDMEKLFLDKNITFENHVNDRDYIGTIKGLRDTVLYFLSAKEITNRLDEGSIHAGLTGDDLIQEKIFNFNFSDSILSDAHSRNIVLLCSTKKKSNKNLPFGVNKALYIPTFGPNL